MIITKEKGNHTNGNCHNNPKCLRGFGERKKGIWTANKNLQNPNQLIRSPDTPYIGLRVRKQSKTNEIIIIQLKC